MRLKSLLLATASFALMTAAAQAQAQTLSGQVSSAEEGMMEGVLVSAKKDGATVTTTVVSNDKGQFSFPAGKLEPGKYNITIRAAGYTLAGPKSVEVAAAGASADIKLNKARNVAPQLPTENGCSASRPDQFGILPARLPGLPHAPTRVHRGA